MTDESSEPAVAAVLATQEELLTAQFYDWERRGRGWQVWGQPVELEPPFRPFFFHYATAVGPYPDDARKPTFIGGAFERLRDWLLRRSRRDVLVEGVPDEPEPKAFLDDSPLVETRISIPPDLEITRDAAERFLLSLPWRPGPVSYEVVGTSERITVQVASRERDRAELRQQLRAYFPEAVLTEQTEPLSQLWDAGDARETVIADFGLSREFMLPLQTFRNFDVDPLIGITGALSELERDELAVLQILFQPCRRPWAESIMRAVTDWEGQPFFAEAQVLQALVGSQGVSFFADAPEMVKLAKEKVSRPLVAAVVRIAARSPRFGRAWQIVRSLGGPLRQFASPSGNELIPLSNDDYGEAEHEEDLLLRRNRRSGMILNSEELVSLLHLPSASVRAEKLVRQEKKTRAAPAIAAGHDLVLGENVHQGVATPVTLEAEQRTRHTYVIGASGTGKSTLLLNMIVQDLRNGHGFAVLDPHGDLIDQVLGHVPEERHQDVVILDPSDADYPVGFNILQAHSEVEKNLMASDLASVFRRLSTSWGDQMTSVLGNAILAFLESERGGTLADLRRFLVEPEFRRAFLATVRDPEVVYYWQKEFPLLGGKPQAPLLTRLDTFLRPRLIRHMVSQKENRLDFRSIMDRGKIFLAKLAQGAIGEENAYLLGTLLVSKFQQIALSRQEVEAAARRPFFLYIDEFQNFITPSMASILSGARKYRLGLVLAHQDLRQLGKDPELLGAVLANPYARICFQVGDDDAKRLEHGLASFDARDLQNLGRGEAICRVERAEYDFNLKTPPLPVVEMALARQRRERLIALSRERYAARREEVEAALRPQPAEVEAPTLTEARPRETREARAPEWAPEPRPTRVREKAPAPPQAPPSPGRGGLDHKYWQHFIKTWADKKGYRATIEKAVLDGSGSVDVAVESGAWSVAFEISVTSSLDQELKNVQKCLAAGFQRVVLVLPAGKAVARARERIAARVDEKDRERIHFVPAEELPFLLPELEAEAAGTEGTVRGYKVKVEYKPIDEHEKKARRRRISEVILKSLRKFTGKEDKPSGPEDGLRP